MSKPIHFLLSQDKNLTTVLSGLTQMPSLHSLLLCKAYTYINLGHILHNVYLERFSAHKLICIPKTLDNKKAKRLVAEALSPVFAVPWHRSLNTDFQRGGAASPSLLLFACSLKWVERILKNMQNYAEFY